MENNQELTNEHLKKQGRFGDNQFKLVNYAILLATNMIESGRDPRVKIDSRNRAVQVLAEISNGKDKIDEIIVKERYDTAQEFPTGTFKTSNVRAVEQETERESIFKN